MNEYVYAAQTDPSLYAFLIVVFALFFFFMVILVVFEKRKSKKYREVIGDLYVAAKIREIAKGEDINLNVENDNFLKWCKKKRFEDKSWSYDNEVEEELMEKVGEKINPKTTS